MTDLFFLVTTVFVAYVVYVIVNEKKAGQDSVQTKAAASTPSQSATITDKPKAATAKPAAKPKEKAEKPAPKVAAAKAVPEKPAPVMATVTAPAPAPEKPAARAKAAAPKKVAPTQSAAPKTAMVAKVAGEKPAAKKVADKPAAAPTPAKASVKKAEKPAPVAAVAATPKTLKGSGLKDPKTGEVTTAYANYRFAKRWIKEALVAEKLLDKVYKNEEINADISGKIKAGLIQLENMKKYQP